LDSSVDPRNAQHRARFLKELQCKIPQVDPKDAEEQLLSIAAQLVSTQAQEGPPSAPAPEAKDATTLLADMPQEAVAQAEAMLTDPLLIMRVLDDVAALGVAGERETTGTVYLIGVSRLLDRPLAGIVQGPSSSGKSYLIEKTASLFPPEAV